MENKNDIGEIFKDKLSYLDKTPSDALWISIEKDLDKKKKRRFLFWLFPSLLLIGIATTIIISNSDYNYSDNEKDSKNTLKNSSLDASSNKVKNTSANSADAKQITTISESDSKTKNSRINNSYNSKINKTEKLVNQSKKRNVSSKENEKYEVSKKQNLIVRNHKTTLKKEKNSVLKNTKAKKTRKSKITKNENNNLKTQTQAIENSNLIANNDKQTEIKNASIQSDETKIDSTKDNTSDKKITSLKKKKEPKENDSIPKLDSIKTRKYDIYLTPYYGFNYYGKIGKGNSISNQYDEYKNTGKINTDFGIYTRWMFNEKIGFRIGFGKTTVLNTINITKINNDIIDISSVELSENMTESTINNQFANDSEVLLTQETSYFEIPLEGYYVFSNKKIGMATAFGLSYYYLKENNITLQSNSVSEFEIGRSKNISPVSFSANLNVIFFYKINKTFSFDVSPSFKYQFLSNKDISGFNPYLLSLRAGISYKL